MRTVDIPQVDRLAHVRRVLEAVAGGAQSIETIQACSGISSRHVGYRLHAARVLGWLELPEEDAPEIAKAGRALLATEVASEAEQLLFAKAIRNSKTIQRLAPSLLAKKPPSLEALSSRIRGQSGLAPATARRRAQALLHWREEALPGQPTLFTDYIHATTAAEAVPVSGMQRTRRSGVRRIGTGREDEERHGAGLFVARLQIRGYGPIQSIDTRLNRFCVMVGRNATGKSTFMDCLAIVSDCVNSGIEEALRLRCSDLRDLLWQRRGASFAIAVEVWLPESLRRQVNQDTARYELEIGTLEAGDVGIIAENLFLKPSGDLSSDCITQRPATTWRKVLSNSPAGHAWYGSERSTWKTVFSIGNRNLALASIPEDTTRFPATVQVKRLFERGIQKLALHAAAMRAPCSPLRPKDLVPDGSNLPLVIQGLRKDHGDRFTDWLEHLREALPDVEDVRVVEREEDRHLYVKLSYSGGLELPAWRLSEGTLRILALTLIPFASTGSAVTLIEEPENGIHPQAVEAVHQTLAFPFDTQILVATHSPIFVGIVRPEEILVFSRPRGATLVTAGPDHRALQDWQRDVNLGDLFAAAVLA